MSPDGSDSTRSEPLLKRLVRTLRGFPSREYSFNILIGLVIGVIGGYGAVGFRLAIQAVGLAGYGIADPAFDYLVSLPWYWRFAIPVAGGLIVGPIVTFLAAEVKGHGVPEVMGAVAVRGGIIRWPVALAKVVASAVTIGSGGSAGREGPIVQIGSGAASVLGQLFKVSARKMKTFVGCGAAAGIAATFNAPVAGMLFSLEVILGNFAVSNISPIIVASVTATAISRMMLGNQPAFAVPEYTLSSPIELVHYAVLGFAAAFVAVAFTKTLATSERLFDGWKFPNWLKPAVGGMIIGALGAFGLPHVYGVGYEIIETALLGGFPLGLMFALIAAKIIATSATLGSGGSGGILAPSLFLGSVTGGVIWYGAKFVTPELVAATPGPYALVGMAAVVAAATRAPLQAILILFELTGGYEVILPLMLSSILATIFGNRLMTDSIYTVKLTAKGIKLGQVGEVDVLKGIQVREVMRPEFIAVPDNMRLRPLLDRISESAEHSTVFVVDRDERLVGHVSFHELRQILFDVEALEPVLVAADIAELTPASVTPKETLDVVMRMFAERNLDELPVVDPSEPRRIIGSIHRDDVAIAYSDEIIKRDLAGSLTSSIHAAHKLQQSHLAPGYSMAEIELPVAFAGRDLRTLDLRNTEGIEVLVVRRRHPEHPGTVESVIPSADLVLRHGDVLLISGPQEIVQRLANA
ncbi:MAG: H(+)/Cl(-) exchange transporter ClcA [Calditrichaeota bacterium]|nr:H(+)/Cl(-) exchange transporter ClcA [Calditrichota bacterium]